MTLSFKHEDAYKMLNRFRHIPQAIEGFLMLNGSTVTITDVASHQLLIGALVGGTLISSVYNFSHAPYGELFDGLCAACSSETPMIIRHTISSIDDKIIPAFEESRLELFATSKTVKRQGSCVIITANIRYPT